MIEKIGSSDSDPDRDSSPNFNKLNPNYTEPEKKQQPSASKVQSQKKNLTFATKTVPRLIIDKIILTNFKSYAGTQTIGPFHHNFTSVVGPNGSGKSNLIQCLLFIFGFRASWMRLSKINQLIHKSAKMMNVHNATVQVHFKEVLDQDDGSVLPVQRSEFSVTRNVNENSLSKYYINNRDSNVEEVKQKLMSKGIDLANNRFLILQGEVEQITNMKQKSGDANNPGLLEYLQQIIGSNEFLQRITNNIEEYGKIQQTRHEKGERMKLAQNQLRSMNKGKDQAIKFVRLEKKVFQLQNIVLQLKVRKHYISYTNNQSKLKEMQIKKEKAIAEQREKLLKQLERTKQTKMITNKLAETERNLKNLSDQFENLNQRDTHLRGECTFKTEDQVKLRLKKEQLDKDSYKIVEDASITAQQLPKKSLALKKLKQLLKQDERKLQKFGPFEFPVQYASLTTQRKQLSMRIESLIQKRQYYQTRLRKIRDNQKNKIMDESEIKNAKQEIKNNIAKLQQAIESITSSIKNAKNSIRSYETQQARISTEIDRVEFRLKQQHGEKEQMGKNQTMFQKIMKRKIPGVLGRLGDHGKASNSLYDQIISSCCPQIDNMIVRTSEAGQQVLNYLKQAQLGKITCIVLDKLQDNTHFMNKEFICPPNTVRLFDQIKTQSEEIRRVFYNALNDTLYCSDGELAKSLAYDDRNRRRVVTKKKHGDGIIIMEKNGMMGSWGIKRGGLTGTSNIFNQPNRTQIDSRQQQQERDKLKLELNKIVDRKRQVELKLKQLNEDYNHIEPVLRQNQSKLNLITEQETQAHKHNSNKLRLLNQTQSIAKQILQLDKSIQVSQPQLKSLDQKIKNIEEIKQKRQGPQVQQLRININKLAQQKKQLERQVNRMNQVIGSTQSRIGKVNREKDQTNKRIVKLQQSIQSLNQEIQKIESEGKRILMARAEQENNLIKYKEIKQTQERLSKQQESIVAEAKRRIQTIKQQVQHYKSIYKKSLQEYEKIKKQLDNIRSAYQKIIAGYDFLTQLQEIQKMFAQDKKNNSFEQKNQVSLLEQSILNNSSDGRSKINLIEMLNNIQPLKDLTNQQYDNLNRFEQQLNTLLAAENQTLQKTEGNSISIISQFKNKYIEYKQKFNQYQRVRIALSDLKRQIDILKQKRLTKFREGFEIIGAKLKQVYQFLTRGGDAELQLIDSLDPFSDGINFSVRPPKKSWKQINKLSGGEKTLSSLSLIFALHYYKPTPLYFMDQIDAALDYKNVSIVANYIKKRTKNAQFIIISLRNNMFELANKLVGVYKTNDMTKTISIIPELVLKRIEDRQKIQQLQNQH